MDSGIVTVSGQIDLPSTRIKITRTTTSPMGGKLAETSFNITFQIVNSGMYFDLTATELVVSSCVNRKVGSEERKKFPEQPDAITLW